MTARKAGSGISAALGAIQHARSGPQAVDTRIPAYPDTQPADTRIPGPGKAGGKRSDPRYVQLKAYVLTDTKRLAMRKAQDQGHEDFSDLVQQLLDRYLNTEYSRRSNGS